MKVVFSVFSVECSQMSYMKADSGWSQPRDFSGAVQICSSNIQKISQNSEHHRHTQAHTDVCVFTVNTLLLCAAVQIKNLLHQQGARQESSELQDKL